MKMEKGAERNLEKAIYWYQKAASDSNKNLEKAFYWYLKAAENGNKIAIYNLAKCYENGEGIKKNLKKAFYWYQKAAENEYIEAQYDLALLYQEGRKIEKNFKKALYWYQKIATNDFKVIQKYIIDENYYKVLAKSLEPMMRFTVELEDEIYNKCNKCFKKEDL